MSEVYYNDNNDYCCQVLEARIKDGHLPKGWVDNRDIREVKAEELKPYKQIHLFAGIGGFPLGFQWAGVPTDFSIITGGFPCQDISAAGRGAGIDGERSGLWAEMYRLIRDIRPRHILVENVPALAGRGLGRVLGDLAAIGLDSEWDSVPAAAFGSDQIRERIFILAYAKHDRLEVRRGAGFISKKVLKCSGVCELESPGGTIKTDKALARFAGNQTQWKREPPMDRVVDGIPRRVDRIKALGNAIVPQIAQWLAERILTTPTPQES